MKTPRFSDKDKFKLPYKRAAFSRAPGYLRRRFEKYFPGWKTKQKGESA